MTAQRLGRWPATAARSAKSAPEFLPTESAPSGERMGKRMKNGVGNHFVWEREMAERMVPDHSPDTILPSPVLHGGLHPRLRAMGLKPGGSHEGGLVQGHAAPTIPTWLVYISCLLMSRCRMPETGEKGIAQHGSAGERRAAEPQIVGARLAVRSVALALRPRGAGSRHPHLEQTEGDGCRADRHDIV